MKMKMTKPTQKQINEIIESELSGHDQELYGYHVYQEKYILEAIKLSWQKAQDEILDEWIKWLDEKYLYLRKLGQDETYQRLFAEKSYELRNRKDKSLGGGK